MKKFIVIFCIVILSGCSYDSTPQSIPSEMQNQIEDLTNRINILEQEKSKLIAENSELKSFKENIELNGKKLQDEKRIELEEQNKFKNVIFNDINVIENYGEFIIKSAEFKQKVIPPNPDSFYSYYEVKDPNEIYLDIVMEFKNTTTTSIKASEITRMKIIYDENYKYDSVPIIEESGGGDFTFANITQVDPLKSRTLHYLAFLPLETKENSKPIKVQFTIYKSNYEIIIRG